MNEAKSHPIKTEAATETDVEPSKTPRIRFNPEINLGHILQIIALTGAVITGYVSLQRDMASMRAEYQVAMAGFESRLTVAEHAIVERRQEDREFATEMRAAVVDIQKGLNNLQLQFVERPKAR
jgi:hypothetical protein